MEGEKTVKGRSGIRRAAIAVCAVACAALAAALVVWVGLPAYLRWTMDHIDTRYPALRAMTRSVPPSRSIKMASVEDLSVDGPSGVVPVRRYEPSSLKPGAPDILYMHGGGFVIGGPALVDRFCRLLARSASCRIYSVDYRLAPENPYPVAVNECYAVLSWLRGQDGPAEPSGARRIVVAGDSAGANLAAVLCLMCRDRGAALPTGQILVCPPVGSVPGASGTGKDSRAENPQGTLTLKSIDFFVRAYLVDPAARRDDPYVNPIRAASLAGLPPALVVTCGRDPLREEGRAYAKRLAESGSRTETADFPDKDHDYQGPETVAAAAAFMAGL